MTKIVDLNNNQIIIKGKRTSLLIISVLTFVMVISGLIPILATVFLIWSGIELHFGLLISYILFWGGGYYLLRLVLWNLYGQEILTLRKDKIIYIADYKLFKDGRQEIGLKNLTAEIIYSDEPNNSVGRIQLSSDTITITSVTNIKISELEKIEEKLKTCYNSK